MHLVHGTAASACSGCTAQPPSPFRAHELHFLPPNGPPCSVVLGMLPKLDLTGLPGDPPGMRYPVACLVSCCY